MNEQENKDIFNSIEEPSNHTNTNLSQDDNVPQVEIILDPKPEAQNPSAMMEDDTVSEDEADASDVEIMNGAFFEKSQAQNNEDHTQEPPNSTFTAQPEQPAVEKVSFFQKQQKLLLLLGCFALGIAGSVVGNIMSGTFQNNSAVMYQSVKTENVEVSDVKAVAKNCAPSVVEIKTESVSTHSFFSNAISSGAGSGVILSKDGYIVTNHHVIEGANKVTVTTKDGKVFDAKLIGTDQSSDLAVIKVEATDLTPAIQGQSSTLEVGDAAIAIGNPLGELGGTVTNGIISALDREVTIDNQTMHLLQTNAAINPGNSGGGLFNAKGELIGVVNAKSSGENIEGLGFAIPIDRAKPIIENLISNGYVKDRATLGVSLSASQNPFDKSESVYITGIVKGGAAEKAGLKEGDQILKIDDTEITSISQLKDVITSHKAGDRINIMILRSHETKQVSVTLQEAQEDNQTTNQSQPINPYPGYNGGENYFGNDDFFDIEDFFNFFGN
jgi:serine protease Do